MVQSGCRSCKSERQRQRHLDDPWYAKEAHFKRKYRITRSDYEVMLAEQGGRCAICKKEPCDKMLAVDHNHKTGKVRQLLCDNCNHLIGFAGESTSTLMSAIVYLERHA